MKGFTSLLQLHLWNFPFKYLNLFCNTILQSFQSFAFLSLISTKKFALKFMLLVSLLLLKSATVHKFNKALKLLLIETELTRQVCFKEVHWKVTPYLHEECLIKPHFINILYNEHNRSITLHKYENTWNNFLAKKKEVLKSWAISDLMAFYKNLMNSRCSKLHQQEKKIVWFPRAAHPHTHVFLTTLIRQRTSEPWLICATSQVTQVNRAKWSVYCLMENFALISPFSISQREA